MIKLIKNADVYAPQHLGRRDILIAGEKVMAVEPEIRGFDGLDGVETFDLDGGRLVPGLIDLHVHVTGGGGEQGPASRVPEITLTQLTTAGVTTVLGLLGTDGTSRSQENLLAKCRALTEEGITCYSLTGSYQYPSVTATGSAVRDIALLDPCVGVKVAMSDHRSSNMSVHELVRLGSDARLGGLISGKAGVVAIHIGSGKTGLEPLFAAMEQSDIPVKTFLPTHVGRNPALIAQALRFAAMGGTVDFTASPEGAKGGAARIIADALSGGAGITRMTISSDACGSKPRFDERGECVGLTFDTPDVLHTELVRMVEKENLTLETALMPLTANPARVLGKEGVKGCIMAGADADFVALDGSLGIRHVFARGKAAVLDGKALMKGRFEL